MPLAAAATSSVIAATGRVGATCRHFKLRPLLSAMLLGGAVPVFGATDASGPVVSPSAPTSGISSREASGPITVAGETPSTPIDAPEEPSAEPTRERSGSITAVQAPVEAEIEVAPSSEGAENPDAKIVGDEEFLPADEFEEALPEAPPPAVKASAPRAAAKWGMAPVRWGGVVSAGIRQRDTDGSKFNEQIYEGRLRLSSYLMQPWIAVITGNVGLTMVRTQSGGDGSPASNNLTGTSITGDGIVNVFPQSRFPFQASLGVSDSRSDGSLVDANTRRVRLGLRQDYRPEDGAWSTSARYDRSVITGDFGRDTVDALGAAFNTSLGKHSVSTNGSLSRNRSDTGSIDDRNVVLRHGYRASQALFIDSNATYAAQEFDYSGDEFPLTGETRNAQIYSTVIWTPYDSPWRGTGSFRYLNTRNDINGSVSDVSNLGGGASLTYQANRNLSAFGSLNANSTKTRQGTNTSVSETLGFSYSGDPRMLDQYSYNWYGSGTFSNASSSEGESQRSTSGTAGHSLQRTWQVSPAAILSGSVNQSAGVSHSTGIDSASSVSLAHGASITLQANPSDRLSGYLGVSVSDSRASGDNESSFQLLNVQLSGRWRINALSELNSNLTWQLSRQRSTQTEISGQSRDIDSQVSSLSGNVGYSHIRTFGVRGLVYTLNFRANTSRADASRQAGNPDATREQASWDLDQRLRYSIGRLDTELQVRTARIEDRTEGLIFFKASRAFGSF